jgi:glycosyltransferase involved in cell wall biosynthesis
VLSPKIAGMVPDVSIVVPLFNEEESLPELVEWIARVMLAEQLSYELILVDDGSTDSSWSVIRQLQQDQSVIKAIRFRRNYGKSAALNVGFRKAVGDLVLTMDADLQDSPDEIPLLRRHLLENNFDLVSGWKKIRHDPASKTLPSRLFNRVTQWMSGIPLHDFNCGLKIYRRDVIKNIQLYGEMHRYIPVMAKWAGFRRIGEKVVEHRARKYGVSKFGLERFFNGFLDLLTLFFLGKFGKRPMHFFGMFGILSFVMGFIILVYLSISKLFFQTEGMASRPLFYLGILTVIVGTQLFLTGFLAELMVRFLVDRDTYQVEEEL